VHVVCWYNLIMSELICQSQFLILVTVIIKQHIYFVELKALLHLVERSFMHIQIILVLNHVHIDWTEYFYTTVPQYQKRMLMSIRSGNFKFVALQLSSLLTHLVICFIFLCCNISSLTNVIQSKFWILVRQNPLIDFCATG